MAEHENDIRALIERWAIAVHTGDMDGVLADHAEDIVMYDVTAGDDVAFAHALLRCGTEEGLRADPDNRLRLTIGLRREGGRWVVAHEHHSFPDKD